MSRLVTHCADFFLLLGRRGFRQGGQQPVDGNKSLLFLFAQHVFTVETHHLLVLELLLQSFVARAHLFLTRILCDADLVEIMLDPVIHVLFTQDQVVIGAWSAALLCCPRRFHAGLVLIPLGQRGGHVHLFDDIAPAHARVVGAE